MEKNILQGHLMAFICPVFWGSAYVVGKLLLGHDLAPTQIILCRQSLALFILWLLTVKHRPFIGWQGLKQEQYIIFAGILGAAMYYLLEISALNFTLAANVSLLVTTSPLFSALLERLYPDGRQTALGKRFYIGMVCCLIGAALVVMNGNLMPGQNPLGNMLGNIMALAASASWAGYSFFLNKAIAVNAKREQPLSSLLLTRRTLFFGLLVIAFAYLMQGRGFNSAVFTPGALLPLLFLAIFPSCSAFIMWGKAINRIGVIKTSVYIYFSPVVAIIAATLLLDEYMTPFSIAGAAMILLGLAITQGLIGGKKSKLNADTQG